MSAFDPKRTWVIGYPLFRLDAGRLNDRPPLLDFRLLVGAKRLRRLLFARRNFKALGFEFLTDVGSCNVFTAAVLSLSMMSFGLS
jgi:hypothetical protein